jgi:hypothetical protein
MSRLIHETSPYLFQHANNPADWSKESTKESIMLTLNQQGVNIKKVITN